MNEVKNFLSKKILIEIFPVLAFIVIIFILIVSVISFATGKSLVEDTVNNMREKSLVINNQLYTESYKELLNKYLIDKGYVSLERLVFYLQRTNNVLDISTLSFELWDKAYLSNINEDEKQMIPIRTICKTLKEDKSLPNFTIVSGDNSDSVSIDVIDLCYKDGIDITLSDDYDETYYPLPFIFPLKENFSITSIVFENRDIDLGLSEEEQEKVNFHSGWDIQVPIGTNFFSVCDGVIANIVNTQDNDLPFKDSGNNIGNYISINCDNNLTIMYYHIQYKSQPSNINIGSFVKKGDLLGRTSTTGQSTGPHLHLELKDDKGDLLDIMAYIDFIDYEN